MGDGLIAGGELPEHLDAEGVMRILPHRYPFLMVDRIAKIDGNRIVGIKSVTINSAMKEQKDGFGNQFRVWPPTKKEPPKNGWLR